MAELSRAAQAVHDAFWNHPNGKPLEEPPDTDQLIAALRAVANQVLPHSAWGPNDRDTPAFYRWSQKMKSRSWILNIATELEDQL